MNLIHRGERHRRRFRRLIAFSRHFLQRDRFRRFLVVPVDSDTSSSITVGVIILVSGKRERQHFVVVVVVVVVGVVVVVFGRRRRRRREEKFHEHR